MFTNALKVTDGYYIPQRMEQRPALRLITNRTAAPQIIIETVTDSYGEAAAAWVREEVFEREWKIRVPRLPRWDAGSGITLVARAAGQPDPIAALTVMETTGEHHMHGRLGLLFPPGTRIARYTQLAVLKSFRGLKIPHQLVAEARQRFVAPEGIDYTWLLFSAASAKNSSFCRELGFRAGADVIVTEYGRSRVLIRSERVIPDNGACALQQLTAEEWVAQ